MEDLKIGDQIKSKDAYSATFGTWGIGTIVNIEQYGEVNYYGVDFENHNHVPAISSTLLKEYFQILNAVTTDFTFTHQFIKGCFKQDFIIPNRTNILAIKIIRRENEYSIVELINSTDFTKQIYKTIKNDFNKKKTEEIIEEKEPGPPF